MTAGSPAAARVSAVILSYNRRDALAALLDRLVPLGFGEVVVVDNGSDDGTAEMLAQRSEPLVVRLLDENVGVAGRNVGARLASSELLLFLDDDAYPLPGAVEELVAAIDSDATIAVVAGLVRDVDAGGAVLLEDEVGTFDWWLRAGRPPPTPPGGYSAFFFAEGASLVRRDAFLEAGGFYEPYFFGNAELDLATRLVPRGWSVRYLPEALFDHLKVPSGRMAFEDTLAIRIRNQLWYFWLRFPTSVALRRWVQYGAFDLFNALHRGVPRAFPRGVAMAWRQRDRVRSDRRPIPRSLVRAVERDRWRLHVELVRRRLADRLARRRRPG